MATVSSDYAVQMHGITKRFGAFYALKDMNLDVKKGRSIPFWVKMGREKVH